MSEYLVKESVNSDDLTSSRWLHEWESILHDLPDVVNHYPTPESFYPVSQLPINSSTRSFAYDDVLLMPAAEWRQWLPRYLCSCIAYTRHTDLDYALSSKNLVTFQRNRVRLLKALEREYMYPNVITYIDRIMEKAFQIMHHHCLQTRSFTPAANPFLTPSSCYYMLSKPTLNDYLHIDLTLADYLK